MSDYREEAAEIIKGGYYKQAVNLMDDDLREALHRRLYTGKKLDFLAAYMTAHFYKYGKEFTI